MNNISKYFVSFILLLNKGKQYSHKGMYDIVCEALLLMHDLEFNYQCKELKIGGRDKNSPF